MYIYAMSGNTMHNLPDNEFHSDSSSECGAGEVPVRIGRWSKQEHARFMEGYKMFGKDWRRVAEFVGTRNNVQVRTHAQKSFKKMRKLELARIKTQRIIAAHRSGLSDAERAKVLEQIEHASRIEMQHHGTSFSPPLLSPILSPQGQPRGVPGTMGGTTTTSGLKLPTLSLPGDAPFLASPPLMSPMLMSNHPQFQLPPNFGLLQPLDLPIPSTLTSPSSSSSSSSLATHQPRQQQQQMSSQQQPPAFNMNGTLFPRLASLSTLPGQPLPAAPAGRVTTQNNFKFFQDWSVDVK